VVRVPARRGHVDLRAVISELGKRQILNLVIEAGSELTGAALEAGIVDKMILFYAPKIMGSGVPMAQIARSWFAKSPALTNLKLSRYGPDFAVEGYFHDVYGNHGSRRKD
jgi:diaminohydroxyphosphoribosylaminopyrimidine deaminase/5-amino-6-(5-phosphoribosylamino)uracil reductase